MKKGISLWLLLSVIFIAVLIVSNTVVYGLIIHENKKQIKKEEEKLLLGIGKQLAIEDSIKRALQSNKSSVALEQYTNKIAEIHGLDFVVIMNMDGIRLTHPNTNEIGQRFEGGDEKEALLGKEQISISNGTLGQSLRGFVPIFSGSEQIGVVAIGIKLPNLEALVEHASEEYACSLTISILIALMGSSLVAYYLKRQLLNLEPKEITRLLEERNAMLNETKDVILVTDNQRIITLANTAAKTLYVQLGGEFSLLEGKGIDVLIQDNDHYDFKKKDEQLYRQNGQDYLISIAPIVVRKKTVGFIVFLRNATASLLVMDQLENTTSYASTLQNKSHEFMNKLHVIYGLVDLEAYIQLKIYLNDILAPEEMFTNSISILVKNPMIAGFLVGERETFSNYNISLQIEVASELPNNLNYEKTIAIVNLYRYIHHVFIEEQGPQELAVIISCEKEQLISKYKTKRNKEECQKIISIFKGNYFKELLKATEGSFFIDKKPTEMIFIFKIKYEGDLL